MPTIQIQADVSVDALVKAAEQLSETDLRQLTAHVLAIHAKRTAPSVPSEEADLLTQINERLSSHLQKRYDELIDKRDAESLDSEEHAELLELTKHAEAFDAARVEALTNLAALRGLTLSQLMRQLQIDSAVAEE
jgi:iron-sulfur cluster repair protein YtfE (RIC family)